jgi:hypothetical protein
MDIVKKGKIQGKLRKLLNREPTENEVINAQNDQIIINQVLEDDIEELKKEIKLLKNKK